MTSFIFNRQAERDLNWFKKVKYSVSLQVRGAERADPEARRSQAQQVLGINSVSRIGWIIHRYLQLVPGLANDEENMAETTEIFDELLNLELLDHYERMTTKKRMSTEAMQQWLTGAAFHLHIRIHQVGWCFTYENALVRGTSRVKVTDFII